MAKYKRDYSGIKNLSRQVRSMKTIAMSGINVGWIEGTDPDTLYKVWRMELAVFERGGAYEGWAVARRMKLKMRQYYLTMFVNAWRLGLRGQSLWHKIGKSTRDLWEETLLETNSPPNTSATIAMKREKAWGDNEAKWGSKAKYAKGLGRYGPSQVFVETGGSLEAIQYEVVPRLAVGSSV